MSPYLVVIVKELIAVELNGLVLEFRDESTRGKILSVLPVLSVIQGRAGWKRYSIGSLASDWIGISMPSPFLLSHRFVGVDIITASLWGQSCGHKG
jgi:hypothetical protein